MVAFDIRDGQHRSRVTLNRFPANIGRASTADVVLRSAGVWEQHGQILLDEKDCKFRLVAAPDAIILQNGTKVSEVRLASGDVVQIGAAELVFLLAPARQSSLAGKEAFFWALLVAVTISELLLLRIF